MTAGYTCCIIAAACWYYHLQVSERLAVNQEKDAQLGLSNSMTVYAVRRAWSMRQQEKSTGPLQICHEWFCADGTPFQTLQKDVRLRAVARCPDAI